MHSNRSPIFVSLTCTLLFAGLAAATLGGEARPKRYVVTESGAVGDGQTVNTKVIQVLIDRASTEGGGVLVVPKGAFMSGALFFKKGVNLLVEKDGILKGTANPEDYPQIKTRWEGVERQWTSAFLNFDNMTNVTMTGEGMIDGSGDIWLQRGGFRGRGRGGVTNQPASQATQQVDRAAAPAAGATNAPAAGTGPRRGRPRMICFTNCRNVRVADLHLQRQAVWCLHFLYCEDVVADNLNIRAIERIPSSDGIDVDSCRNVRITRCDIACNDDNIAIKCGKDEDGLRVNRPSENITISDCTIGAGAGITMGSEVSGSIRHVLVERCTFTGSGAAARFKSQPSRGGVVEDIVYRDIKLNDPRLAFEFNLEWRMVPPIAPPAKVLTVVRNVRLINFSGTTQSGGIMHGLKDSPIRNVKFENCNFTAQRGLRIENAVDLDTSGLKIQVQEGESIITNAPAIPPAE